jgi:hypothetical protein
MQEYVPPSAFALLYEETKSTEGSIPMCMMEPNRIEAEAPSHDLCMTYAPAKPESLHRYFDNSRENLAANSTLPSWLILTLLVPLGPDPKVVPL